VDGALVGVVASHKPDNMQSFVCLTWLLRFQIQNIMAVQYMGWVFHFQGFKTKHLHQV
jgi:hypothetical protein